MEYLKSSIINKRKSPVVLVHGKGDTGKTALLKMAMKGTNYIYIGMSENENSIEKILKEMNIGNVSKEIIPESLILQRLERVIGTEGRTVIFDNIEKMDKDGLSIFFNLSIKVLHRGYSGLIIGIYNDCCLKNNLKGMFTLLRAQGALDFQVKRPGIEEFKMFIKESGTIIPEPILRLVYESTNGNYETAEKILEEFERKGYIVEKTFIKSTDSSVMDEIKKITMDVIKGELGYHGLDANSKTILFIIENVGEIDEDELKEILGLDTAQYIGKLLKNRIISRRGKILNIKKKVPISIPNEREIYRAIARWYESKNIFDLAGKYYYLAGEYKKSERILCSAKNIKINVQNARYCLNVLNRPKVALALLDYFEQNEMFDEFYSLSKKLYDAHPDKIEYVLSFAKATSMRNDYKTASELYRKVLKSDVKPIHRLDAMMGISRIYYNKENFKKALDYSIRALKLAIQTNNKSKEAEIYKLMGNIHYYNYNDESAKSYYEKSLEIYRELNKEKKIAMIYNNLANIYSENNIKKSMQYYSKSLRMSEKNWWISLIVSININLGILSYYTGNIEDAIYRERRSIGLALARKDYPQAILPLSYLLDIQMMMGDYTQAEEITRLGLEISRKSSANLTYRTFRLDRQIINFIMGRHEENIVLSQISSDIPAHSEVKKFYSSLLKFYNGDIKGYIEEFRTHFIIPDKKIKISEVMDFINYIETLLYMNYFEPVYTDEVKKLKMEIEGIRDITELKLARWRLNIIDAVLDLEKKNSRNSFFENIKNIEGQNLRYLSARLKIIYGLYYSDRTGDRSILNMGLNEMKSFGMPGLLNIYRDAFAKNA